LPISGSQLGSRVPHWVMPLFLHPVNK
jgi:hypothetical protein